jgi:hypothetical protein
MLRKYKETIEEKQSKEKSKKIIDNSYFCRAKNCREIMRPDWRSNIDPRYCKDCLD